MTALRTRRAAALIAATGLSALAVGCASASSSSTTARSAPASTPSLSSSAPTSSASAAGGPAPTVLAAASLTKVFPKIESGAKYTFGGSGMLAAQIDQGAPADVYAAASPKDPATLLAKGLIDKPSVFATNTLVLIVPTRNPARIKSVAQITRPGVKIVICNATVPCGDYARNAFMHLGISTAAMNNVVRQATDVTQVVAEVASGQADVGFVYVTDAKAAMGKVSVVHLPAAAKPGTMDEIAVVKKAPDPAAAKAFVARVLSGQGQAMLRAAGFGKP